VAFRPTNQPTAYELTDKGNTLINSTLVEPIKKKFKLKTDKSEMFSRCPSGTSYYITEYPTASNPYFIGKVAEYRGCNPNELCVFRLHENEDNLEVWDENKSAYKSSKEWIANTKKLSSKKEQNTEVEQGAEGSN
jgi:hypothetical protein